MTIKEIIKNDKLQTEVDEIKRFSAVDIDYVTKDGVHCETQLDVSHSKMLWCRKQYEYFSKIRR